MKRIYLIDCPGIVPPSMSDTSEDILLRGVVRVENVENPAQYIPAVLSKCKQHHLERTYEMKGWSVNDKPFAEKTDKERMDESIKFLEVLARRGGRLLKGGEADMDGVAKMVLNDFLRGKIPWFSPPPSDAEVEGEGAAATTTTVNGEEKKEEAGRDEKLGLTHKKRKREEFEANQPRIEKKTAGEEDEEDEEDDDSDDVYEDADDFEGFEEEGEDEESDDASEDATAGGVKVQINPDESDEDTPP